MIDIVYVLRHKDKIKGVFTNIVKAREEENKLLIKGIRKNDISIEMHVLR